MNNKPIHILLVEDSPSDAILLRQLFSRLNSGEWELIWVERLSDAIESCSDFLFDVALLDLSLPDSDGLETVAEFNAAAPDIPIVVLTGADDEEMGLQAVAKGAQDYIVKDQITVQLLVRAIRYAIERGQILKQLHDSERRFRGIFDQTFQLMLLLSPEGIILEINKTSLAFCGGKQNDFVGSPLWEIDCLYDSQVTQEWLKSAIANAAEGNFVRNELQMCGAESAIVWIDLSLKPLKDERGKTILLIAEGRDISDRKRAEAEVLKSLEKERELNQLKSSFISMVSHEFRNPMTAIRTAAQILQSYGDRLTEEQKIKYFDQIKNAVNNTTQLLEEVLLLGKTDANRLQYQPATLDLKDFCRELMENLQFTATEQHNITFTCAGECSQVEMDEFLMGHIFNNLISNAIKYSPQGGNVRFNLICQNGTAIFQIQDEGIGIPLKDRQHLFETFYRGSNVNRIQGTGLGLAIVKKCVDLHRGQIQLQSDVGAGTTFIVTLPLTRFAEVPRHIIECGV
ncbi:sensor histidine kinase [Aerosakkonema funiforme]|uniref:sensor histidine kinase n=1 Tax=Aerosakkonema funiforme TaxID=1246630 RepID=UPI0035B75E67